MQYLIQKSEFIKELDIHPSTFRLFINEGLPILKPTHEVTFIDLRDAETWLSQQTSKKRKALRELIRKLIISKSHKHA